ncbi:similar to Saccharomyces cerevisiae YNL177C MRPL22 Mitochondrial ribosomal protein of the large subunit [Maudiozyma barnettii]|uniref:Similar to Saccharomyces cerevisiae YNL177C MRPL22 Mitochondrial ribosomal protein of the large subunit n=1 Tax=Maudiozyma barnettii TaxID=61262 RepID=A0A8H2ZHF5_9SACH|nr:mitochondrial 54S ribosomal protein YmL22 [Kazachstania barnettii]CAB4253893.1 similar to Saccharomyces cerevisiae YNL177C MRPL22 Mitochondrial ribosomal protein of the large subunit [Kazachstania barnettii]CAD1781643.1 similar to Saccharomyces cerevisiae YNL177C MRPL22 Mitochondrial ribosomal protein of the large subunit [Kazachstania barnettii]
MFTVSRNVFRLATPNVYRFRTLTRPFSISPIHFNSKNSLFGELETKTHEKNSLPNQNDGAVEGRENASKLTERLEMAMERDEDEEETPEQQEARKNAITFDNDEHLQKYINEQRPLQKPSTEILLSPLKRQLYEIACKQNGGFYKPGTIVTLPSSKESYKLQLTKKEIEVLEPSLYLKSYRIKSSMKKATIFLRLLREMDLKKAITQCQFGDKAVSQEVSELLLRGLEDAKTMNLDPNDLYIAQIWCGSDGNWWKRIDIKGRGRHGIFTHRYIHIRCILKSKSVTKGRLEYEAQLKEFKKKPWVQLRDKPIRGSVGGVYKW